MAWIPSGRILNDSFPIDACDKHQLPVFPSAGNTDWRGRQTTATVSSQTCWLLMETMLALLRTQLLCWPNWGFLVDDLAQASVSSLPCSREHWLKRKADNCLLFCQFPNLLVIFGNYACRDENSTILVAKLGSCVVDDLIQTSVSSLPCSREYWLKRKTDNCYCFCQFLNLWIIIGNYAWGAENSTNLLAKFGGCGRWPDTSISCQPSLQQGILTEVEGWVQLTSSLR
jgi:hypothetical protein